jgi:predicted transcriptional regulator
VAEETIHVRIPISLKTEVDELAELEQRNRVTVLTRLLKMAIAIEKRKNGQAIAS